MKNAILEHVNITVSDPQKTAAMLGDIFGWHVRWQGPSLNDGYTVHVGTEKDYLAIYSTGASDDKKRSTYEIKGGLNHIGIVVDDFEDTERRVRQAGHEPYSYADYEPGRRFYFKDENKIEFEVICYGNSK
jgi:catechol 2,3-dioxygenase-like lactoylglutathione lyase family enzyme